MSHHDDDLTMESTTDSAEQIADGLGVELTPAEEPIVEAAAEGDDVQVDDEPAVGDESAVDDPDEAEPVGEVTSHPAKVVAPKKTEKKVIARPQRKSVDGAAAAARRKADAREAVLKDENEALRDRLKELSGHPVGAVVARRAATVTDVPITADDVPDTHPDVAAVLSRIGKLGARPKQADFDDFEKFEDARETWIKDTAKLEARLEGVREDVARRETVAAGEARTAALATKTAWDTSVAEAQTAHDDYDDVVAEANEAGVRVSRDVATALMESTIGARVLYYLASHPKEVTRINALSPHRQIAEVGMLEGRIAATLRTDTGARGTARPGVRTTKAPEPQRHLVGDLPSRGRSRDERLNDPAISQAEYNRLRNEIDVESGRRTH